ncbi:MAG: helix-turn-helix domain-containing protein [Caldilineaceae bacterium]
MAKSFTQLLKALPQERRDRIEERAQELLLEMALQELRQKRHLTQQQLAERLNLQQAAVSKMEGQADMHVGTLQRVIAAMGGKLKLVAQFPDEEIVINQFEQQLL